MQVRFLVTFLIFRPRHSLVFLPVVSQYEILQLDLYFDPVVVAERGPDVMRLRQCGLVRLQQDFGSLGVNVERAQNEDQTAERLPTETATMSMQYGIVLQALPS